jgi:FkbM family methyltransferase
LITFLKLKTYMLRVYLWINGRDLLEKKDVLIKYDIIGSEYGCWPVVPSLVSSESTIYLVGVGSDVSFDVGLIERFGVRVHAFDPTPEAIQYVKDNVITDNFIMHEYGLYKNDEIVQFYMPKNENYVSHSIYDKGGKKEFYVEMKRLQTIMSELNHEHIDLLKMDIEGAEYDVISDMMESGILPDQLLIEFHHRFENIKSAKTRGSIELLRSFGYLLFYISDSGTDYGFVRSGLV